MAAFNMRRLLADLGQLMDWIDRRWMRMYQDFDALVMQASRSLQSGR